MQRRKFILGSVCSPLLVRPAFAAAPRIEVFKSPTCGCCSAWVEHIQAAGFHVDVQDVDDDKLWSVKDEAGIDPAFRSCHTGFVEGYFIEGHVASTDVTRLLTERPKALGLAVPGMPIGSPGMEMGNQREAYNTLLILRDGSSAVFSENV